MSNSIVYIGTSESIISELVTQTKFKLICTICEKKRVTNSYLNQLSKFELLLKTFNTKSDFISLINSFEKKTIFIIYQLDLIVPKELIENYTFFNFHSGSIFSNRGAHPIIRTILNNERNSEFTLHKIDEKIDQGFLVSVYKIDVDVNDSSKEIKMKLEKGFPLLLNDLVDYIEGAKELKKILGGTYYKPICEQDYTFDLLKDDILEIKNKIRSQKWYNGAIAFYDGKKFFINDIMELNNSSNVPEKVMIHSNTIQVYRKNKTLELKINYSEDEMD